MLLDHGAQIDALDKVILYKTVSVTAAVAIIKQSTANTMPRVWLCVSADRQHSFSRCCENRTHRLCRTSDSVQSRDQHARQSTHFYHTVTSGGQRMYCNGFLSPQEGDTPLHDAVRHNRLKIIEFLLQHAADTSLTNQVKLTCGGCSDCRKN